jgi:hypothetical protein
MTVQRIMSSILAVAAATRSGLGDREKVFRETSEVIANGLVNPLVDMLTVDVTNR